MFFFNIRALRVGNPHHARQCIPTYLWFRTILLRFLFVRHLCPECFFRKVFLNICTHVLYRVHTHGVFAICTTCPNIKRHCSVPAVCICVFLTMKSGRCDMNIKNIFVMSTQCFLWGKNFIFKHFWVNFALGAVRIWNSYSNALLSFKSKCELRGRPADECSYVMSVVASPVVSEVWDPRSLPRGSVCVFL